MKSTARNTFIGEVIHIQTGTVFAEVIMKLLGGEQLVAEVGVGSVKELEIAVGKEAIALIKASCVILMTESGDIRLTARNCLEGQVLSITVGDIKSEVEVKLVGGSKVYSMMSPATVSDLGIAAGSSVMVMINSSHIILGVPPEKRNCPAWASTLYQEPREGQGVPLILDDQRSLRELRQMLDDLT